MTVERLSRSHLLHWHALLDWNAPTDEHALALVGLHHSWLNDHYLLRLIGIPEVTAEVRAALEPIPVAGDVPLNVLGSQSLILRIHEVDQTLMLL